MFPKIQLRLKTIHNTRQGPKSFILGLLLAAIVILLLPHIQEK